MLTRSHESDAGEMTKAVGCPGVARGVSAPPEAGKAAFLRVVEYGLMAVFCTTRFLARVVPPSVLDALFNVLGSIAFCSFPGMKRRLKQKVTSAMPEITDQRRVALIGRGACIALLRPILDLSIFWKHGDRYMSELRVEGIENLEKADASGKGVILVGGHVGQNAIRVPVMARLGRPYTPIYYHPADTPVARYYGRMLEFGRCLGCDPHEPVFWAGRGIKGKVTEHLMNGRRVGIDFDVDGRCVVDFFGRPAAMAAGIGHFAMETGAAVVPFVLLRGERVFDNRLIFHEPITVKRAGDRSEGIRTIIGEVAKAGERMIRDAPEQWESWFGLWHFWDQAAGLTGNVYQAGSQAPRPIDR